jgi:hypothetical protein
VSTGRGGLRPARCVNPACPAPDQGLTLTGIRTRYGPDPAGRQAPEAVVSTWECDGCHVTTVTEQVGWAAR